MIEKNETLDINYNDVSVQKDGNLILGDDYISDEKDTSKYDKTLDKTLSEDCFVEVSKDYLEFILTENRIMKSALNNIAHNNGKYSFSGNEKRLAQRALNRIQHVESNI